MKKSIINKISITNKIMMFFLAVIFFVIISIMIYSNSTLKKNNEFIIDKETKETAKSINMHLDQYFGFKMMDFNEDNFSIEATNISNDLSYRLDNRVYIYNSKGKILYPREGNNRVLKDTKDFKKAKHGFLSYTIDYNDSKTKVYVSYPVLKEGNLIGIIRYVNDYTVLYQQSSIFIEKILIFSIAIFMVSIIVAYAISKQLTKPIMTLTKKTQEIANGNFDIEIDIESNDEFGKLSRDFKTMAEKIKYQVKIIEKDRDNLREISEKQKKFFDNVTHELKTPMTTIIGYSEVLKDNQFSDEKFFNKGINRIISEATRLNRMIVQLIEISRNSNRDFDYDLKKLNFSNIIIHMCEDMLYKAKKYNMNIVTDIEDNLKIIANEDKIKEVIINLIDNAIKYGKVNTSIYVSAWSDGGLINLRIKDSGKGINEAEIENILSPFYRVSQSETRELGSTGLGLAIVKSIVDSYNGEIIIKSEVSVGTEVLIKLPTIG